ncbi:hypothetical protein [Streptomyces mesophilus]|uniref:golvesin C-terminal-like domain-containing protein n=1 Tax=Streptomyces mesophilus TaxID=1775132 RepID=UPI00331F82AC
MRAPVAALAAGSVLAGVAQSSAWAEDTVGKTPSVQSVPATTEKDAVPSDKRAAVLGEDYKKSGDVAWTTSSDINGFHLLTARESDGYQWRTTASLSEPGFDTDAWIGNACVTASGKRAVVVYAPRTFTNKADLMARGAFTAVVDLTTGEVTKLKLQASLSYYNPGCGVGESAVLTQSGGEDKSATRLFTLDATTARLSKGIETKGQVTSSVVTEDGSIVGANGARIVKIDTQGNKTPLLDTDAVPYRLVPDADGGLAFLDRERTVATGKAKTAEHANGGTRVKHLTAGQIAKPNAKITKAAVLAEGPLTETALVRSAGKVYVTGKATKTKDRKLPSAVRLLEGVPKGTQVSTRGEALVTGTEWTDGQGALIRAADPDAPRPVNVKLTAVDSGEKAVFTVEPGKRTSPAIGEGKQRTPALAAPKGDVSGATAKSGVSTMAVGDRNEIVENERVCSVPRNDPRNQAMQPKPRQVEWAVNQAIRGNLNAHVNRPANWKSLGMPAYQPQSLFPAPALEGGGSVPAQVMLGVTAQESNMWQASRVAVPGVTGNPLIGNYYGIDYYDGDTSNEWDIDWAEADCGYGITQVTDHMRMAGREDGHGGAAWPYDKQRAVALDYTANVAAGLQILVSKWNETKKAGLQINNGNPAKLENWTFALWAYNSGFYANKGDGSAWGVGWANNPANPEWDAGRSPFMEDSAGNEEAADAAHPQDWPYQEKVLGFAAHPPSFLEAPGKLVPAFRAAWWNGTEGGASVDGSAVQNRAKAKPPEDSFCTAANSCDPARISDSASNSAGTGPCRLSDFKCWWHLPVTWKDDCDYSCGNDFTRFPADWAEEADGTAYPPNCSPNSGLPGNAMIIDDVPAGTPLTRCGNESWTNEGSFRFDFGPGETACDLCYVRWPAKVDLHQLGAGAGGHFYFGHTRKNDSQGNRLKFTGTWTLNKAVNGPAKVYVHLPDHGAHTTQARYEIDTAKGKRYRTIKQKGDSNRWVSLGAFLFDGAPKVSLSTITPDGTGDQDIAFDAVAVAPISGTYVEDTVEAVAFFDEDQNIDAAASAQAIDTPFKSRQALYDWGMKTSGAVMAEPTCEGAPKQDCVMPEIKAAMTKWHNAVKEAGTDPADHPDGKGITNWMHYSNPYTDRPTSDSKPSRFDTDDSAYKIRNKATVSYVKTSDGKIVEGSEFAEYDSRTADTHLPDFVMEAFAAIQKDYGLSAPDLNYKAADLNEHNGAVTTTDTNSTGILPGREYASMGKKPVIVDAQGNPVSDGSGTCVSALHASGGSIGYRPMLGVSSATDAAFDWKYKAHNDVRFNLKVADVIGEIYNAFFKPGKTGSLYNTAPPIWQELNFQSCTDGTIRKNSNRPLLRSSFMPSQYLYHNDKAMDLDGNLSGNALPVVSGNFNKFSEAATTDVSEMPYGDCNSGSGQGGNPWGLDQLDAPEANPSGHFCVDSGLKPDPEFSD